MPSQEKEELVRLFRGNVDVFAWDAYDASGVDPSLTCHHLNVNPSSTPKKQPPRRPLKEHAGAVRDEVAKLKKAGGTLHWKVYVDGAANQRGSGIRIVLISPDGAAIEKSLRLGFSATNNEAEYEALLQGMTMVQRLSGRVIEAFSDSRLVVGQVIGELEARDARMKEYLGQVKRLQTSFESFNLTHISRSVNTHADSLATLATSSAHNLPRMILVEDLV